MFIKYICDNCKSKRVFSTVQKDTILCKKCNNKMKLCKDCISVNVMSTPEARYIGDEAMFGTIGDRISGKHKQNHAVKT